MRFDFSTRHSFAKIGTHHVEIRRASVDIHQKIAEELQIRKTQVDTVVALIDQGSTIPFIARYRKEATGGLNDEQLRLLDVRLRSLRNLEERRERILSSIEEQGKLTEALKKRIMEADSAVSLEDLYLPYRPKRTTRATIAAEKGLSGLADIIWEQRTEKTLEEEADSFLSEEKGVCSLEDAIAGACDILAERFSEASAVRSLSLIHI